MCVGVCVVGRGAKTHVVLWSSTQDPVDLSVSVSLIP